MDISSSKIIIYETYTFHLDQPSDTEAVVVFTRQMAKQAGFNTTDEFMIAVAASELATNILRYAGIGEITINVIGAHEHNGIEIIALDKGAGISDIDLAMQEGYTTTEKSLGMGLPSVKKIMDEFEIKSGLQLGTLVKARKWC
jgi:serine/threonine-protein kinase RsbT